MTINDERPLNVWRFKDLFPGDIFEFKEKIYMKITKNNNNLFYSKANENEKGCCNAFNLTQNEVKYFDDGVFVVKLYCELNIKG